MEEHLDTGDREAAYAAAARAAEIGERFGEADLSTCARHLQGRVLIEQGEVATLLKEATTSQMLKAGNVGGELLDWIAMLGTVGERRPKFVISQMEQGHAYAAWRWS